MRAEYEGYIKQFGVPLPYNIFKLVMEEAIHREGFSPEAALYWLIKFTEKPRTTRLSVVNDECNVLAALGFFVSGKLDINT